jgi:hypothetical protein
MKLILVIPAKELMFVIVPDTTKKYEVVNYGYAGTWLMESGSKELNAWKVKIPNGRYEVIGPIKDVVSPESLSEIETDKNFILRKL